MTEFECDEVSSASESESDYGGESFDKGDRSNQHDASPDPVDSVDSPIVD